jgi:hypothetical protein
VNKESREKKRRGRGEKEERERRRGEEEKRRNMKYTGFDKIFSRDCKYQYSATRGSNPVSLANSSKNALLRAGTRHAA